MALEVWLNGHSVIWKRRSRVVDQLVDQLRQEFWGGGPRKCDTYKALDFLTLQFGTRGSEVQILSPRPLIPFASSTCRRLRAWCFRPFRPITRILDEKSFGSSEPKPASPPFLFLCETPRSSYETVSCRVNCLWNERPPGGTQEVGPLYVPLYMRYIRGPVLYVRLWKGPACFAVQLSATWRRKEMDANGRRSDHVLQRP